MARVQASGVSREWTLEIEKEEDELYFEDELGPFCSFTVIIGSYGELTG